MYETNGQVLGASALAIPVVFGLTKSASITLYVAIGLFLLITTFAIIHKIRNSQKSKFKK